MPDPRPLSTLRVKPRVAMMCHHMTADNVIAARCIRRTARERRSGGASAAEETYRGGANDGATGEADENDGPTTTAVGYGR